MSIQSEISAEIFNQFIEHDLPFAKMFNISAIEMKREAVVLRARNSSNALRPGGTIAGPVMMGLADAALYAVVIANIGMVELAVTTNLSINFLRKPGPGDLFCRAKILKLGKRLAVCEASIYYLVDDKDQKREELVAHVTGTYSIPPASTPASKGQTSNA